VTVEEALDDDRDMIPALSTLQHTTDFRENKLCRAGQRLSISSPAILVFLRPILK
jgi:hypothetical protein